MDLSSLHKRMLPCDVDSPYVFISYSSNDKEIVWKDVIELQNRGYNIWIDEANIDRTKSSWEEDALKAIECSNCVLLAFYVSRSSLVSKACLNEIAMTCAESTIETHDGNVNFFVIECEYINDIGDYYKRLLQEVRSSDLDHDKKDDTLRIISRFKNKWIPADNKKIRIHPQKLENGRLVYYEEIEKELCHPQTNVKFSPQRLYRFAINCIIKNKKYDIVARLLSLGVKYKDLPSALMLAHYERVNNSNEELSVQLWSDVDKEVPFDMWMEQGENEKENKCFFEAVAWQMAYGEKNNDPDALLEASKTWTLLGSKEQTINTLRLAASMGSYKAKMALPQIKRFSEEQFRHFAERHKNNLI